MRTILPQDITSREEVVAFFEALASNHELWHIEDSAHDIYVHGTDQRLFTDEEADQLESLISQCHALVEDPCEYAYKAFVKYMQPI